MNKKLTLSALLATAVLIASPAMAAQDTKAGANVAGIEVIVANANLVNTLQNQQQQQQQQTNLIGASAEAGVLLVASNDQGFDV